MSRRSRSERRSHKDSIERCRLELNDIQDLFGPPRFNAFQENYMPVAGIDRLVLQLRVMRPRRLLHVTFVLPESPSTSSLEELHTQIEAAIKRYCDMRLSNLRVEMKARQLTVIRSLEIGVIILAISLALGAAITRTESMTEAVRTLLSNAVSIFGSVALWSPADAFLFGIRPMYHDEHIYETIRDMTFDIQVHNVDPPNQHAQP